jgi:hypothetical protein|tara:strand:+ start:273 stop:485 length:213 start_codon:yes stop_codon:yes gene_type:complete
LLFDPRGHGLHDPIAETLVIYQHGDDVLRMSRNGVVDPPTHGRPATCFEGMAEMSETKDVERASSRRVTP